MVLRSPGMPLPVSCRGNQNPLLYTFLKYRRPFRTEEQMADTPARIPLIKSERLRGETAKLFDQRLREGFWGRFVRPGLVIDIGYKGYEDSTPVFRDSLGLDMDSPGYDGRNLPYEDGSVGTVHASHFLEHVADYGYFFRECLRALAAEGTLILFVPLMEAYERRRALPSHWNPDHKRFYTASRLLFEIESTLPRNSYRVLHLRERIRTADFSLPESIHAVGPYEIECVIEKIRPDGVY
jgi:SAM-dependent methyltransferase